MTEWELAMDVMLNHGIPAPLPDHEKVALAWRAGKKTVYSIWRRTGLTREYIAEELAKLEACAPSL